MWLIWPTIEQGSQTLFSPLPCSTICLMLIWQMTNDIRYSHVIAKQYEDREDMLEGGLSERMTFDIEL